MRLYNGCPDDALQAVWDHRDAVRAKLAALGIRATWYPAECVYIGFSGGCHYTQRNELVETGLPIKQVTGPHRSLDGVLSEAEKLTQGELHGTISE